MQEFMSSAEGEEDSTDKQNISEGPDVSVSIRFVVSNYYESILVFCIQFYVMNFLELI